MVYRGLRERKRLGVSHLSNEEIDELLASRRQDGSVLTVTRSKPVIVVNAVLTPGTSQSYGFSQFQMGYAALMGQAFHMLSPLTAFIYLLLNLTKQGMGA